MRSCHERARADGRRFGHPASSTLFLDCSFSSAMTPKAGPPTQAQRTRNWVHTVPARRPCWIRASAPGGSGVAQPTHRAPSRPDRSRLGHRRQPRSRVPRTWSGEPLPLSRWPCSGTRSMAWLNIQVAGPLPTALPRALVHESRTGSGSSRSGTGPQRFRWPRAPFAAPAGHSQQRALCRRAEIGPCQQPCCAP